MSIDRRLLGWGIFLVLLGGIPLAANQGLVPRGTFDRSWQLWPLLLVGAGIGLILSRTRLAFIGGAVMAATAGVIGGGLLVSGINLDSIGCSGPAGGATALQRDGTFMVQPAKVTLRIDCGSLTVNASGSGAWRVQSTGDEKAAPSVTSSDGSLTVRSPGGRPFGFLGGGKGAAWTVSLPTGGLDLTAELNAADGHFSLGGLTFARLDVQANAAGTRLDLGNATIETLNLESNAADFRITLPSTGASGTLGANASSVHLCAPPNVRLRLTLVDSNITTDNFAARGLVKSGSTWESPNTGGPLVDLRIDANAATLTLDGPDDCR